MSEEQSVGASGKEADGVDLQNAENMRVQTMYKVI
jgi:hypothetical protein